MNLNLWKAKRLLKRVESAENMLAKFEDYKLVLLARLNRNKSKFDAQLEKMTLEEQKQFAYDYGFVEVEPEEKRERD